MARTRTLSVVEATRRDVHNAEQAIEDAFEQFESAQRMHLKALRDTMQERLNAAFSVGSDD